jgi:hypothetical protein
VGEFDLLVLFEEVGRVAGRRAAAGWGGGRFELWQRRATARCEAPCIARDVGVLGLRWDTERDRAEGERALESVIEDGLDGRPTVSRAGLGLWSSRGGAIAMLGSDRATSVVFAPGTALAARLIGAPATRGRTASAG